MDQDINQMVSCDIISMEIIIQGEADQCDRTIGEAVSKPGPLDAFHGDTGKSDIGIVLDVGYVIVDKWTFQRIRINQEDKTGEAG